MSWVTVVWGILIGGCVGIALPHVLVGIWLKRAANLFFVLAAAAVIGIAFGELLMMRADSVQQFARVQQWTHVPIFILYVALIGFVRPYLNAGRLWLALTACASRFVALVINFVFPPNLNYRQITELRPIRFLGETVSTPVGVVSQWTRLGELCSLLLLIFVVDASISAWRKSKSKDRRRILVVGGTTTFFILLAAGETALIHRHIIAAPYMVSFPFAAILLAMAFELGSDLFRAGVAQELQRSEASLHESEDRFRTMADSAPVLIWMSGPDKLCTFFNKAWLVFTGRPIEQELGNGWADCVHPDDLKRCTKTYETAFDRREQFIMQYRLRRYDGVFRTVTDEGVPRYGAKGTFRGYIGACVDITDSIEQKRALREIEERVTLATEAAQFGVWELDVNTGEVWLSDKVRELFQFTPDQKVTYAVFQKRVHPGDRAKREAAIQRAIESGGGYEIEYRVLCPDGTIRWMSGRARCITDDDGKSCRLLGVSMDVTNRKQAEEEARHRREQIDLLSRASLLGEMTASLAHELNQPLSAIVSNANAGTRFIDKGTVDPVQLREILADVGADGRRAYDIIETVRGAVKKGTAIRGRINLNDVVRGVAHMVQPDAAVHFANVEMSLADNLPAVKGDPTQMQQALINLVRNAFDAMRDTPADQRTVEIATEYSGDGAISVAVRDHGAGISQTSRERLFEQFFTTKEEGLGMGLAIVRSIIQTHGGRIMAENAPGGGARFSFTLPIVKDIPA